VGRLVPEAEKRGLRIALETDLAPVDFRDFMAQYPAQILGANVDLGNSAMWGWDMFSECRLYGDRIFNVHIKDGVIGGSTVPLLTGHTDFTRCFKALKEARYKGDFILQTAPDEDYLGVAEKYKNMTQAWAEAL
jgi:hexulose-6-phosphate isomerase